MKEKQGRKGRREEGWAGFFHLKGNVSQRMRRNTKEMLHIIGQKNRNTNPISDNKHNEDMMKYKMSF